MNRLRLGWLRETVTAPGFGRGVIFGFVGAVLLLFGMSACLDGMTEQIDDRRFVETRDSLAAVRHELVESDERLIEEQEAHAETHERYLDAARLASTNRQSYDNQRFEIETISHDSLAVRARRAVARLDLDRRLPNRQRPDG